MTRGALMFGTEQTAGTGWNIVRGSWLFLSQRRNARGIRAGRRIMLSWIILGLVGWALGFLFVMVLMRISADEDRAARHQQKRLDPYSDVSITAIRNS